MSTRSSNTALKPVTPTALCHVVLVTTKANFEKMITFYMTALNATISHRTDTLCFLTYDHEHHRIALAADENALPKDPAKPQAGMHHVAFGFPTLTDLADAYEYRAAAPGGGIKPYWCVNHGVTMSMYYTDPDGNRIEFQVDLFDTAEEANAYMASSAFAENPIGVEFDPDEFVRRVRSGDEDEAAIKARPDIGKRNTIVLG
ncbi:Glyoxalase/Bleomycin resistance protein/Dihydroxybiphenyl dioxygenase [Apiospora kogelbergensis]|uniref:Glyoxalase/Bleomycin resistance protein/Dihydroxybiphenyl dioxygenase n=1 Tax=Apiospora kogelbergensis TaxID=1337665 RepID=UPI00312D9F98